LPSWLRKEAVVDDLTNPEIQALGRAVGLDIQEPELTEVAYSLNAILEMMDEIDVPGVNAVEPLPLILPTGEV
jgi:Asp-tRNA(Asn)/Glu-tRNA(Gln) amidotransferase C subunit